MQPCATSTETPAWYNKTKNESKTGSDTNIDVTYNAWCVIARDRDCETLRLILLGFRLDVSWFFTFEISSQTKTRAYVSSTPASGAAHCKQVQRLSERAPEHVSTRCRKRNPIDSWTSILPSDWLSPQGWLLGNLEAVVLGNALLTAPCWARNGMTSITTQAERTCLPPVNMRLLPITQKCARVDTADSRPLWPR